MRYLYKFLYAILEICMLPLSVIIFLWKVASKRATEEHDAIYHAKNKIPKNIRKQDIK